MSHETKIILHSISKTMKSIHKKGFLPYLESLLACKKFIILYKVINRHCSVLRNKIIL